MKLHDIKHLYVIDKTPSQNVKNPIKIKHKMLLETNEVSANLVWVSKCIYM